MEQRPDSQRVVITGLGALSPLGLNVNALWEGLLAGRSGIALISQFDPEDMPTRIAGEVKGFDATKWINFKEARRMGRATQMAVVAALTVQDVIAAIGSRNPPAGPQSEAWRQAFIFVSLGGPPDGPARSKVERLRTAWVAYFRRSTEDRLTVEPRLD